MRIMTRAYERMHKNCEYPRLYLGCNTGGEVGKAAANSRVAGGGVDSSIQPLGEETSLGSIADCQDVDVLHRKPMSVLEQKSAKLGKIS